MMPLHGSNLLRRILRGAGATLLLLLVIIISIGLVIGEQAQRHDARRADAILVMGAAQWDGAPSPVLAARLDTALALYRRGLAGRIILTGGTAPGDSFSEASVARDYLVEQGVEASALLLEEQGRSSFASLSAVVALAQDEEISSVVLVSDPYHLLRSLKMARDLGLEAYGEPAEAAQPDGALARYRALLYEAVGYLGYVLFGV